MSDFRDDIDREIVQRQVFLKPQRVESQQAFDVFNEWIQCYSLNKSGPLGSSIALSNGSTAFPSVFGPDSFFVSEKPFFVAGQQKLRNVSGLPILVWRAPREEMFSSVSGRDYANNGSQFSRVYQISTTIGVLSSPLNWLYLSANNTWVEAPLNNINVIPANVFGREGNPSAAFKNFYGEVNGRYYEIDYEIVSTAGVPTFGIFRPGVFAPTNNAIALGSNSPSVGTCRVGDVHQALSASPPFGVGGVFFSSVHNSEAWTLVVTNSVAATLSGVISVTRQGF